MEGRYGTRTYLFVYYESGVRKMMPSPNHPPPPAVTQYRAQYFPPYYHSKPGPQGLVLHGPSEFCLVISGENAEDQARKLAWELHDDASMKEIEDDTAREED